MTYRKYKYHVTDKNKTTSVQHTLTAESDRFHYGLHLYDAFGWDNLPWKEIAPKGVRFFCKFGKAAGKVMHLEIIFFRFMLRFCVIDKLS